MDLRNLLIVVFILVFGIGPKAIPDPSVFEEIIGITGGELIQVDNPVDVIEFDRHGRAGRDDDG